MFVKNRFALSLACTLVFTNQLVMAAEEIDPVFLNYSTAVQAEKLGNRAEAVKTYKTVVDLNPRDYGALMKLGLMHLNSDAQGDLKNKSTMVAIEYLDKAYAIRSDDVLLNLLLGRAYQDLGDVNTSIKYFTRATTLEPKDILLQSNLGQIYFEQKDFKKSIEIFNRVVMAYPENLKARSYLGAALQSTDNYLSAIEQYNYVLSYEPNSYSIRKNLGDCWLALKQFDKARENYELAKVIDPRVPNIYADLAYVSKEEKNYSKAIENYRRAVELKPDDKWKKALAYSLWENNQIEDAINVFDEIKEYKITAYLQQTLGRNEEALSNYQKAIELDPKDYRSRFNLARIYHEIHQSDKAKAEYENLLAQRPDDEEVTFLLGVLEQENGNLDSAVKYYNELLQSYKAEVKLDKDEELIQDSAHFNLGLAYKGKQDFGNAEQSFEKVLKPGTGSFSKTKDVYKELSFIKIALDKDTEAETLINSWLKEDPANIEARNFYADFLVHQSKERKAVEQLRLAAALDQTVKTRLKLANLLHSQNNLYEALSEYQTVLQQDPNNLNALLGAANNFKDLGFKQEAINIYKDTLSKYPDDVLANYNYGLLMQENKEFETAVKHYEKSIAISPDFVQAYYVLGLSYWSLGRKDEAKEIWNKFMNISSDEKIKIEIRRMLEQNTALNSESETSKTPDLINMGSVQELSVHREYNMLQKPVL